MQISKITKLTNTKFLNMYKISYNNRKCHDYFFSSRRSQQNLACNGVVKTDAVRILPFIRSNGKIFVVLIKEFRHALNQYIFSTPAGLVEDGEDSKISAVRELFEETGAKVVNICKVLNASFSSAGLTDETIECFEAEVVLTGKQNLQGFEDIEIQLLCVDDILNFVENNVFDTQSALMLQSFFYKTKY